MKFLDFARTILDERQREGVRGMVQERSRFEVHIATAAFASRPLDAIRPAGGR